MSTDQSSEAGSLIDRGRRLRAALTELLDQEFSYSTGHVATILSGCLFAPSLLTFWFVNGVVEFSTAVAIGAVGSAAGLQVRLLAYLLLVPVFLASRVTLHLLHPGHRAQVLAGSCPTTRLLSLDWFSTGILATGLPLALQNVGPWVGMNVVFVIGVFVLPRAVPEERRDTVRLAAMVAGGGLFLYANYGAAAPGTPTPGTVLGPVATATLAPETTACLVRVVTSIAVGPLVVGGFGVLMNHVLTRPELSTVPLVRHALPRRDPDAVVVTSAATGTLFYLLVVAGATGTVVLVP